MRKKIIAVIGTMLIPLYFAAAPAATASPKQPPTLHCTSKISDISYGQSVAVECADPGGYEAYQVVVKCGIGDTYEYTDAFIGQFNFEPVLVDCVGDSLAPGTVLGFRADVTNF